MSITTLVVIISAPMPKNAGGLVVRASDLLTSIQKTHAQSQTRTQIFFFIHAYTDIIKFDWPYFMPYT